ncbi:MAG: uroporphyrinogen decarboxylase family protein [Fimbriimonadaceae bacterium]
MSTHPKRRVEMTGRERVRRMFAGQEQDSIPRAEGFWPETIDRFRAEGMTGDVLDFLGCDFAMLCWSDPKPFPGQNVVVDEDDETRVVRDEWNNRLRWWKHRSGTPEHVEFACKTRRDWETVFKPRYLATGPQVDFSFVDREYKRGRRNGRWVHLTGLETFEMARRLMGDEVFLMAMIEEPDWVIDFSRTLTDLVIRDFEAVVAAGYDFDGVWIYGDMAYRNGPLCSPAMYREFVWPDHRRLADWAHRRGVPLIFHTDGDVNILIDDYLAAGFDCLQPIEAKANMDIRKLAPVYGGRIAFFGNNDVMVYATNDRDQIEAEIVGKLRAGMSTGKYAYHSDHSVPPSTSWETFQFIVDLLDRHGNYD